MKTHPLLTHPRVTSLALALAMGFGPGGFMPLGLALAAPKASAKASGPTVTLNFVNAEIEGVARAMAAIVNRQILVDPRVKGTITLYSDEPLSQREAYLNFLAALRGQGFAMVEVAGLLKIVPEAEAKLQAGTVDVGAVRRSGDQVLTQIFRIQNENANNLVAVLRPLISPNNTINANPSTNTLVITDYADNLKRIGQMIAALDVPTATDMEVIVLQYAVAADLAPVVQRLIDGGIQAGAGGAGGQGTLVVADSRTNTLMVRAPTPARLTQARSLIQRLDRPGTSGVGGSGIHVVYLKNADAVKLAQVLRAAYPAAGGAGGGTSGATSTGMSAASANLPGAQGNLQNPGSSTSTLAGGASQQSTTPVAASAQPSTGGFIQADPSTNSLIITAPDALYRQLRAVIEQLDGRRAQIYIEAMIVKVDANKAASLGVQWAAGAGSKNLVGAAANLGTTNVKSLSEVITSAATGVPALNGFNVALARRLSDGTISLGALASFLQTEAGGNILSTPNLVTLDNEEAKIVVGENVPFVTGSFTNTGTGSGAVNPFQTVERKDVGLTLRVRPQVGEGGTVRMTIFQEDASVKTLTASAANGPTTSKSSIETTVVVDDGQVLVLGGLMKDEYSDGQSKIPLLGDIPYLGNLFKSQERTRNKTNLMVFLRPIVMRTQDESNALSLDRYDYMRQRQMESKPTESTLLPINEVPVLDPLKQRSRLNLPSVSQPLDDPQNPPATVVMPPDSGYAPKLAPVAPAASGQ